MIKIRWRFLTTILAAMLLFSLLAGSVSAEELPEGIIVADNEGISVDSQTGEFYIQQQLVPGETYVKYITIQNLREDKAFQIFLRTEPLTQTGNYDLFENVVMKLSLGDEVLYEGSPNGLGNIDMQKTAMPLGDVYEPGDTRVLKFEAILPLENTHHGILGAVTFQWIFSATVDEEYTPPVTGVVVSTVLYTVAAMLSILLIVVCLLCKRSGKSLKQILYQDENNPTHTE